MFTAFNSSDAILVNVSLDSPFTKIFTYFVMHCSYFGSSNETTKSFSEIESVDIFVSCCVVHGSLFSDVVVLLFEKTEPL